MGILFILCPTFSLFKISKAIYSFQECELHPTHILKKNIYIVELFKNVTRNPTGKADDYAICLVVIAQNSRAYEL